MEEESLRSKFGLGLMGAQGDVLGRIEQDKGPSGNDAGLSQERPLFGGSLDSIAQEKVVFGGQPSAGQREHVVKTEEMEEEL